MFICLFVVRVIQTHAMTDPGAGFAMAMTIIIFGPILLLMSIVTLMFWFKKRQYDKEWRKRGHTA
jgi:hypothetical protein